MPQQTFGKNGVTLDRDGLAGRLTVPRSKWAKLPWSGIGFGLAMLCFIGAAAALWLRPDIAVMPGIGGCFFMLLVVVFATKDLVRDGIFHDLHTLEVTQRAGTTGAGYREASQAPAWVIRLPHREVPRASAREVVTASRLVQPKDSPSYTVYTLFLVLGDEVLDVASFREDSKSRDRLADALKEWLEVPSRRIDDDPSGSVIPLLIGVFAVMVLLQLPVMFLLGMFAEAAAQVPLEARAVAVALLPIVVRYAAVPGLIGLARPSVAKEVRTKFRVQVPAPKLPVVRLAVTGVVILAGAGGASWLSGQVAEVKEAKAVEEALRIERWEFGHDAIPWVVDPDEDGTWDYLGAFGSNEVNGHTVLALFDGATHETRWRTPPMKMNSGHGHFAVAGERVVVLQSGEAPVSIDLATGADVQAFPDDPRWAKFNPASMCRVPGEASKVWLRGSSSQLFELDVATHTVRELETDRSDWRCSGRVKAARTARVVWGEPVTANLQVGDYMLMLSTPAQIYRGGKLIKQLPSFTDVQDGPICGTEEGGAQAWVPVAAGGGVRFDLERGTFAKAPEPEWCKGDPIPDDEPVLPELDGGLERDSLGLLVGDTVYVSAKEAGRRVVLAYGDRGRTLAWKVDLEGAGRLLDMAADDGQVALAEKLPSGQDRLVVVDTEAKKLAYTQPLTLTGTLHGVRAHPAGIFVAAGQRLDIYDRDDGKPMARHGE